MALRGEKTQNDHFHYHQLGEANINIPCVLIQDWGALDKEVVSHLPDSISLIAVPYAGYDGYDIDACTAKGSFTVLERVSELSIWKSSQALTNIYFLRYHRYQCPWRCLCRYR